MARNERAMIAEETDAIVAARGYERSGRWIALDTVDRSIEATQMRRPDEPLAAVDRERRTM